MEKEADRFVILGGEQVAEGLENALTAQVDNLRHLHNKRVILRSKAILKSKYRSTAGQVGDRPCRLFLGFEVALKQNEMIKTTWVVQWTTLIHIISFRFNSYMYVP